jgi:signal transduction histidine kinase
MGETYLDAIGVGGEPWLIISLPVMVDGEVVEIVQTGRSMADAAQYGAILLRALLGGSSVATLAAFGVGWWLSGLSLRPILRITQTAQAIGRERDLSRRVEHRGPNDEVGQLAATFNGMLAELQVAYQQQQQFVADVSHELRTPLTTLRGNLELLRRDPPISKRDQADVVHDMVGESDRLIRLVNDLLTLARADARRALRRERVALATLIERVLGHARVIDGHRPIVCEIPEGIAALGDPDAIQQVALILVDNALKHATGPIRVKATETAEGVDLSVSDAGPGIPSDVQPYLFDRFYRRPGGMPNSGVGLGLAIARALAEAMGGSLRLESSSTEGATFVASLPRAI